MAEFKYKGTVCEGKVLKEYQNIFNQFGYYGGSIIQYTYHKVIDEYEEEPQVICAIFYILNKDKQTNETHAHIIAPTCNKELDKKKSAVFEIKTFESLKNELDLKNIKLKSIIAPASKKNFAIKNGFTQNKQTNKIGSKTYCEFFLKNNGKSEYRYNILNCNNEKLNQYKEIFSKFEKSASVMEYTLVRDIGQNAEQLLTTIIFMLDKNEKLNQITAHILQPIPAVELTDIQKCACIKAALMNLSKNFQSKDIVLKSLITADIKNKILEENGFVKEGACHRVGTEFYIEFFKE